MSDVSSPAGRRSRPLRIVLILGAASAMLYLALFLFSDTLIAWAAATRNGHKIYALVPVAIAMVFSFVHGAFTARFWDALGLRAKQ